MAPNGLGKRRSTQRTGPQPVQRRGDVATGLTVRTGRAVDQLALVDPLRCLPSGHELVEGAGAVSGVEGSEQRRQIRRRLADLARQAPTSSGEGVVDGTFDVSWRPTRLGEAMKGRAQALHRNAR